MPAVKFHSPSTLKSLSNRVLTASLLHIASEPMWFRGPTVTLKWSSNVIKANNWNVHIGLWPIFWPRDCIDKTGSDTYWFCYIWLMLIKCSDNMRSMLCKYQINMVSPMLCKHQISMVSPWYLSIVEFLLRLVKSLWQSTLWRKNIAFITHAPASHTLITPQVMWALLWIASNRHV